MDPDSAVDIQDELLAEKLKFVDSRLWGGRYNFEKPRRPQVRNRT